MMLTVSHWQPDGYDVVRPSDVLMAVWLWRRQAKWCLMAVWLWRHLASCCHDGHLVVASSGQVRGGQRVVTLSRHGNKDWVMSFSPTAERLWRQPAMVMADDATRSVIHRHPSAMPTSCCLPTDKILMDGMSTRHGHDWLTYWRREQLFITESWKVRTSVYVDVSVHLYTCRQ